MMTEDIRSGDIGLWDSPFINLRGLGVRKDLFLKSLVEKGWHTPSLKEARLIGDLFDLGVGGFPLGKDDSVNGGWSYWTSTKGENQYYHILKLFHTSEGRAHAFLITQAHAYWGERLRWVRAL